MSELIPAGNQQFGARFVMDFAHEIVVRLSKEWQGRVTGRIVDIAPPEIAAHPKKIARIMVGLLSTTVPVTR